MLKQFFIFCFVAFTSFAHAQSANLDRQKNNLPEIGVVASDAISIDKEIQVGDILMRQLRSQAPIVHDPLLEEYIDDLGNRLVAQADNVKFPFTFFWINNKEINAFAFFGGHIGVHTGLLVQADTESEFASVIAHEIAHVTQRHIARRMAAQQKASPLQIASLIGGLLLAAANPEAGIAALSAGSAASQQFSINYTRSNETEADRVGFQTLSKAGFDPAGAAGFFGKLAAKYRSRSKPPQFLLTHPLPESRIADARSRQPLNQSNSVPPKLEFHLVKARVEARFFGETERNIATYQNQLKKSEYVFEEAAKYGLAIAYLDNEQFLEAETIIDGLLKNDPENLYYLDVATDIKLAQNQYKEAIKNLEVISSKMPRNRVISLNLANAAIKMGDYGKASRVIKDYLLINPGHVLSYQLLMEAYGENKQFLEMHQAKAEWYALLAAYPNAIDELHTAYNHAKDNNLEKQRIRARIEQLREAQSRLKRL